MRPVVDASRLHETLASCVRTPSPQTDMEAVRAFIENVVRPYLKDLAFDRLTVDDMGNLVGVFVMFRWIGM